MLAWTLGMFTALSLFGILTGWNIDFFTGWVTVCTWFSAACWFKYKRLTILPDINWGHWFLSVGLSIVAYGIFDAFMRYCDIPSDLIRGIVIGIFYCIVNNDLDRKELEKLEKE